MGLLDLIDEPETKTAQPSPVNGQPLPAVGRNVTLTQVKGYLAQKGISPEVTREVAELINSKFPEPLPPGEVERITDFEPEAPPAQREEPVYYDRHRKEYIVKNQRGVYQSLTESQVKKNLQSKGYSSKSIEGNLSPLNEEILRIRDYCDVDFVGILAGHDAGFYDGAQRLLITDSPTPVQAAAGDCPTIQNLLSQILGPEQLPFFLGWLKFARESLLTKSFRPGQALAIAGERNGFKSFTQNHIITPLIGGRSAKPYSYMMGKTDFNSELFGSEHQIIEDDISSHDIRLRREFASQIKQVTANEIQRCHAKHRTALSLIPFWRLSITLNDEPENLMILPPIDESLADKIIILKTSPADIGRDTSTLEGRKEFKAIIDSELPHFAKLLDDYEIPERLKSSRYGITHYHHPDILAELSAMSPEQKLLELIEGVVLDGCNIWQGTATELERILQQSDRGREAGKLLYWNNATGTYLGRLSKQLPERFEYTRTPTARQWVIRGSMTP